MNGGCYMINYQKLIESNEDDEFVIHIQNEEELNLLVETLEKLDYEYVVPSLGTIREVTEKFAKEDGYDACWRISKQRGINYHPSVEHWKLFISDIYDIEDDRLVIHKGYTSKQAIQIEQQKLRNMMFLDDHKELYRKQFGLENATEKEIAEWLNTFYK